MRSKPWSKLQKKLYALIDRGIGLQVHCVAYPMISGRGSSRLPRYWITLGKDIIWDYPKHFPPENKEDSSGVPYPYANDVSRISGVIEQYISTPQAELAGAEFPDDAWGLADILRAADRRVGRRSLEGMLGRARSEAARRIIAARLKKGSGAEKRDGDNAL